MSLLVCSGAMLQCSFGVAPCSLTVIPQKSFCTMPVATIMDYAPMVNIMPFGMCSSLANPTVAAATAAALGVLTPMPCIPATAAPWIVGKSKVLFGFFPALTSDSKLMCSYGGVIQIIAPGQFKVSL